MIQIEGLYWPDGTRPSQCEHALMHVRSAEWAIARCHKLGRLGTAVQAGGNIGLWPIRMAKSFGMVMCYEPDDVSRQCLDKNVYEITNVFVKRSALGEVVKTCSIAHKSLGGHRVVEGHQIVMATIDAAAIADADFIQLDVEGYEWHALQGATETIARCGPLIQVELRENLLNKYGKSATDVRQWLSGKGYRQVSAQPGSDFVFEAAA